MEKIRVIISIIDKIIGNSLISPFLATVIQIKIELR